jgi:hypothetical protein
MPPVACCFLGPPSHSFLVAAAALGAEEAGKGVDRGARIGMGVETATAWGAKAAPMADEEGPAVGPDFKSVEAVVVSLRTDTDEGRL